MSALPPDDMRRLRQSAFAARHPIDSMIERWQAIAANSANVAKLAGLKDATSLHHPDAFVAALDQASEWQRELAWQGVEDIEALVQSGMAALDVLHARGQDPQVPAIALWRELDAAQRSVMAMLEAL
ncbi:MAG: hypothetical protein ACXIUO_12500 [Erythrobacter sp.]